MHILLTPVFLYCCMLLLGCDHELLGNDYQLFENTPIWNLAKAVRDGDTTEIRTLVHENPSSINYVEPKFGQTLLMLTLRNRQFVSFRILIQLGADIHRHDRHRGASAIILAANSSSYTDTTTAFLELLLKHGANPNDEEVGGIHEPHEMGTTPLVDACKNQNIEKVQLLVEAGADVNYKNGYHMRPLAIATIFRAYNIVLYLLERGANPIDTVTNARPDGRPRYVWDLMREDLQPLNSRRHQEKMRVAEYLKEHGIVDYWQVPIEKFVVEKIKKAYPDSWQEYMAKY